MKTKTIYYCTNCGNETPQWMGKCPACGAWNTLTEHIESSAKALKHADAQLNTERRPKRMSQIVSGSEQRFSTGLGELDRVLGGGAVKGSLVLVGGAPGIGKSTLLLQICRELCKTLTVLYISGEESESQLKMRAERLGVASESLLLFAETEMDEVMRAAKELNPDILIVDSIQTMYAAENATSPGGISQVKDCTMALLQLSKQTGITVFVVGHVNKEGSIAGPKVLEHMVDCVLYFEGERSGAYRLLRAAKNRFGSTNEIGVFEMYDKGLREIPNPSELLLAGRPKFASGTCVACAMEGSRPVLAEVQALVTRSFLNVPRRTTDGFDYNRAALLIAVLEKRGGLRLSDCDLFLNVIGGLRIDEPGSDLPVAIAIASSFRDVPVSDNLTAIGELGLTGETRIVSNLEQRLAEISRLGFTQCVVPRHGTESVTAPKGLQLLRVRNIREAIEIALGSRSHSSSSHTN
ncbi:MAG: DNA repair protein RadA [Oscillospiraceae bacterium]|nr:DNA repair protein RadA [Oscillospiraceae bacterium]